jgi:sugar-specific transcriptional regulator TrmB
MELSQLEKVGLKEKEARVYVALLKEGPSLANHIAKRTNILRSSIYDYLDVLFEKGFVSFVIKSGKKYFQAVDPQKILDIFNEEKKREEQALKEIVPNLAKLKGLFHKKANVELFEGKEGMKTAMSYILKGKPKELLAYGSSGVSYKLLPYFMIHWHRQRVKQKTLLKVIYNDVKEARERLKKGPKLQLTKIKFLPIKNFSLTGTIICGDKVLITMWNVESPLAISIESKIIAKDYKNNFEILWKTAKHRK